MSEKAAKRYVASLDFPKIIKTTAQLNVEQAKAEALAYKTYIENLPVTMTIQQKIVESRLGVPHIASGGDDHGGTLEQRLRQHPRAAVRRRVRRQREGHEAASAAAELDQRAGVRRWRRGMAGAAAGSGWLRDMIARCARSTTLQTSSRSGSTTSSLSCTR
jgi:hypothetical protein